MGRFWSSTTLLLLVGACGDNSGGIPDPTGNGVDVGGNGSPTARYAPQVCGVSAWDPSIALDPALDISVAERPDGGATVMTAPLAGGSLLGFQLTPRMDGGDATKLPITNAAFDHITTAYIQNAPVALALADGAVYVHMLEQDLSSTQYIAKLPATAIGDPAFFYTQNDLVMPIATTEGLVMQKFADSLEPLESKLFMPTKPVLSVTSAQVGGSLLTAWSTETECYLQINNSFTPGEVARTGTACPSPRIAANPKTGDAIMLFDSVDGIRINPIHGTKFGGDSPVLRTGTNSPRVVFDGQRFWVSYLDQRGDVIVGYLDEDGHAKTLSLGAPQPERAGYELIMLDGRPTVFAVDDKGYTAYSMCVEASE